MHIQAIAATVISQPIQQVDPAEAARLILSRHIRMLDGRCRGCFVNYSRLVPHPCIPFDWATSVQAHDMTAQFLDSAALPGSAPAKPQIATERLSA
jgi:hypothetical protein